MENTLFDRELLIERFGNEETVDRLSVVFIKNTQQTTDEIESAVFAEDYLKVADLTHRLRGSALSFCSEDIKAFADDIETALKQEPIKPDVLKERVTALRQFIR